VHRDLKPANVLLGDGGAQLADFGIARLEAEMLTGPMVTRLTETAAVLGTLPYMSPEQRLGGALDRRSDLFSAGVMLYEAATGILPQGAFAPPSELNRAYPRAFDRTVLQLLQADPDRRPASAAQVATALAAALVPRTRRPVALALSGGALAILLVGGTLGARLMLRDRDNRGSSKDSFATVAPETPRPPAAPAKSGPEPPAATDNTVAPEPALPTTLGEATKSTPPTMAGATTSRLGKIKQRVVLKAVSDVKKLRASLKATAEPNLDAKKAQTAELEDPIKAGKLTKDGKPVAPVSKTGKIARVNKKGAVLPPDPEFDQVDAEIKDAVPPATRPDGGAGTDRQLAPKRK